MNLQISSMCVLSATGGHKETCICVRFGSRLRRLRRERGWTQIRLANHLGIDRSFISDLERGKKNISIGYLETIAQGFDISVSELLHDV